MIQVQDKQKALEHFAREFLGAYGKHDVSTLGIQQRLEKCIRLDRHMARIVPLLPLIELAWADGDIHESERAIIKKMAEEQGIGCDVESHELLTQLLLEPKPDDLVFQFGWALLREAMRSAPITLDPTTHEVTLFISHKREIGRQVLHLSEELESLGKGKLRVFSSEQLPATAEWRPEVIKKLQQSNWLLLLYTDPTTTWDWCMYETGFFDSHQCLWGGRNLTVMHRHDDQVPNPVLSWKSVAIDPEKPMAEDGAGSFIDLLYGALDSKIQIPSVFRNGLIDRLVDLFRHEHERARLEQHIPELQLGFENAEFEQLRESGEIPGTAAVEHVRDVAAVFGMGKIGDTWSEFLARLGKPDPRDLISVGIERWVNDLGRELKHVANDRLDCGLPALRSNHTVYRPNVLGIEVAPERATTAGRRWIRIVFTEIPPSFYPRYDGELGSICCLMHYGHLFRWGILSKYRTPTGKFRNIQPPESAKILAEVEAIRVECYAYGFKGEGEFLDAFEEQEDRQAMGELFEEWQRLHENASEYCGKKPSGGKDWLCAVENLNSRFLTLTAKRYKELCDQKLVST